MKKYFTVFTLLLLVLTTTTIHAQKSPEELKQDSIDKERPVNTGYITIGISGAITSFMGDLNVRNNISTLNSFRINPGLHLEKRLGKHFAIGADFQMGKISQNERTGSRNLNFETSLTQMGGHIAFHFDSKAKHVFSPFFAAGISYIKFNVKTDLKDKDGKTYYYWDDNSIRNLPQRDSSPEPIPIPYPPGQSFETLERDFNYETEVKESLDPSKTLNFETGALVFPLTVGAKFRLAEFFDVRISGTYGITQTDFIDAYKAGKNDAYFNTNVSMHYTFGKHFVSEKEKKFKNVDFGGIAKSDVDNDGVYDIMDECPNTPRKVKVDAKGCPLDDDKDGVPNYLDKEPNSPAGSTVNRDGIALSDEELEKLYQVREQVYMEKIERFYEAPSDSTLKSLGLSAADSDPTTAKVQDQKAINLNSLEAIKSKIQERVAGGKVLILPIPANAKYADTNGDGKLQPTELTGAIDSYLDGESDTSVTDLMELIEYFFEQ